MHSAALTTVTRSGFVTVGGTPSSKVGLPRCFPARRPPSAPWLVISHGGLPCQIVVVGGECKRSCETYEIGNQVEAAGWSSMPPMSVERRCPAVCSISGKV